MPPSPPERHAADLPVVSQDILSYATLARMCDSPMGLEGYSPLFEKKYLLFSVEGAEDVAEQQRAQRIATRLRELPCPIIAVGSMHSPALQRGIDVAVPTLGDAQRIIGNINQHPIAAMTLVQLLRHNEDATPLQGLLAESLAYASLQGGAESTRAIAQLRGGQSPIAPGDEPAVVVARDNRELRITLNRPQARNAYNAAMRDELFAALQLLRGDVSIARAVVSGAGSCFSVGGDLSEFGTVSDAATAHAIRSSRNVGAALLQLNERLEFRLHRACIGAGIELPAFAERVVADRCSFMQLPEIKLGLLPGAGGTVSIPARIGRQRTAYMALSARKIKASLALEWGLIDGIQ